MKNVLNTFLLIVFALSATLFINSCDSLCPVRDDRIRLDFQIEIAGNTIIIFSGDSIIRPYETAELSPYKNDRESIVNDWEVLSVKFKFSGPKKQSVVLGRTFTNFAPVGLEEAIWVDAEGVRGNGQEYEVKFIGHGKLNGCNIPTSTFTEAELKALLAQWFLDYEEFRITCARVENTNKADYSGTMSVYIEYRFRGCK
ncbi:MAG: hypothetical protein IIA45_06815 [Bacteroidetes bacterium]|nr:hypothetical protein [Bacteroidota bacterium]